MTVVIGIDPGLTGAIAILNTESGFQSVHDMPQQVKSTKRVRNKKGVMVDRISYEVDASGFGTIIHPIALTTLFDTDQVGVKIYIEQVGAVYRQDKKGGTDAHQPLHATFVFGEGFGVLRGICEAYYGSDSVTRVAPITWKKHFSLLKTEKDFSRVYAIEHLPTAADQLKRKKDIGRADALLIGQYGIDKEQEKLYVNNN